MNIKHFLGIVYRHFTKPRMIPGYRNNKGHFHQKTRISSSTFIDHPQNLNIHDNVYIGHFNFIEASQGVEIGEGCQITNFVSITSHSSHFSIRLYGSTYTETDEHKGYVKGSIWIGAYTFVGPYSLIMPNTRIGKGCLVSAYSHVKGDFPDFSIIGGNPARVTGDTRKLDARYLEQYPELKSYYQQWSGESL